jgi:hypothetical protein
MIDARHSVCFTGRRGAVVSRVHGVIAIHGSGSTESSGTSKILSPPRTKGKKEKKGKKKNTERKLLVYDKFFPFKYPSVIHEGENRATEESKTRISAFSPNGSLLNK